LLACAGAPAPAPTLVPATHADLVALYREFREFRVPDVRDGVPDYTAAAMRAKHEGLARLQARLAAMDTAGWSLAERVDCRVVGAEMSGMDFDHRVLRPWARDPAFYVVFNFQFGPKMHGASRLPGLPAQAEQLEALGQRLRAIPAILEQARSNLTEPAGDLALLGVRSKNREEGMLADFLEELRTHHGELVPDAERALSAIRAFRDWLEAS
jgi:hypothetical protein